MNIRHALTVGALLLASASAQADFYLGAGGYSARLDKVDNASLDESDFTPAVFLGWRPLEVIGVEASYYDLGSYEISGTTIDANAMGLAALLSAELGPVGVYAKAGMAQMNIDITNPPPSVSADDGANPFGGVGASIDVMDKLYVYAEALMFTGDVEINVIGAGLRYAF